MLVIESNRYREKTWTEKLKEAEALEKILKPEAKKQLETHTEQDYHNCEKAVHTLKETAKAIGTSHNTLHKVKTIAKETPEKSDRQIADDFKVDHKTVGAARNDLESRGEIPHVSETTRT